MHMVDNFVKASSGSSAQAQKTQPLPRPIWVKRS
ncbi:MAG: hypothetical protein N838_11885 [Thiohalocapsa sp. PB-PSB1]|nr:MAG: hypothetical protein N838_11885 [Thiohalocapsa sp. PB-PSB1]